MIIPCVLLQTIMKIQQTNSDLHFLGPNNLKRLSRAETTVGHSVTETIMLK